MSAELEARRREARVPHCAGSRTSPIAKHPILHSGMCSVCGVRFDASEMVRSYYGPLVPMHAHGRGTGHWAHHVLQAGPL